MDGLANQSQGKATGSYYVNFKEENNSFGFQKNYVGCKEKTLKQD
jgi:hypothetical protein